MSHVQENVILVTGGLGMLGRYVCRALVAAQYRPIIVDQRLDPASEVPIHDQHVADVCNLRSLRAIVEACRPACIVHLAGLIGSAVEADPYLALQVNLQGNVAVLECARQARVRRVITISSKMVYGRVEAVHGHPDYVPVDEKHPREPHDLYGKLKRAMEDVADHYARAYALDVVALRFASLYAPGKVGKNPRANPIMRLIEAARYGHDLHIPEGGDQKDGLCYAADAAAAVVCAVARPRPADADGLRAYNIASDVVSLYDIITALKDIFPTARLTAGPGLSYRGPRYEGHSFAMDITKARSQLGFEPAWPFPAAAADYCAALS